MITKPPVKTLKQHLDLVAAAKRKNVLCVAELHKRFDPIYMDARDRIRNLGPFSYYFNSHHIDYHEWCMHGKARPVRVTAHGSTGVANVKLGVETEDTITIVVD